MLAIVDGGAVEIDDGDARDESPCRRERLADVAERSHAAPSALTRLNGISAILRRRERANPG